MSVTSDLAAATTERQRQQIIADAHVAIGSRAGLTLSRTVGAHTYAVTVVSGPTRVTLNGVPAIELVLQFLRDGVDVTPVNFNPWHVVSTPILVADPAGTITIGGLTYREDLPTALAAATLDMIRHVFGL